ncbi:hypothetical protein [Reticulibacter mediterranei]|nr:hypothetical protein [Reticulibacter mediterranei]
MRRGQMVGTQVASDRGQRPAQLNTVLPVARIAKGGQPLVGMSQRLALA